MPYKLGASPSVTGSDITGFTEGSVPFAAADGSLTENNSRFYFDNAVTTDVGLGIGTQPDTNYFLNFRGANTALYTDSRGVYISCGTAGDTDNDSIAGTGGIIKLLAGGGGNQITPTKTGNPRAGGYVQIESGPGGYSIGDVDAAVGGDLLFASGGGGAAQDAR